jgi:hypothetical protein
MEFLLSVVTSIRFWVLKSSYNEVDFDSSSSSVNCSRNVHHFGAGPIDGKKYVPIFSCSCGTKNMPEPSLQVSRSFISALGSMLVYKLASSQFQILMIFLSHVRSFLDCAWNLIYLIGSL